MVSSLFLPQVAEFDTRYQPESPANNRFHDLFSEVGELAKELLKNTGYGNQDY